MEKLKPCPFCGGLTHVKLYEPSGGSAFVVSCSFCKVVSPLRYTEAEAIAAWNTRPGEDKLRASGIAAMRKAEELRQQRDELAQFVMGHPLGRDNMAVIRSADAYLKEGN